MNLPENKTVKQPTMVKCFCGIKRVDLDVRIVFSKKTRKIGFESTEYVAKSENWLNTDNNATYTDRKCPTCKRGFKVQPIKATVTDKPCDERCTNAKGHECECSCGGHNHGIGP